MDHPSCLVSSRAKRLHTKSPLVQGCSLQWAAFLDPVSPLLPAPQPSHFSNPQCPTWPPLPFLIPIRWLSTQPPVITVNLLVSAPRSGPHPHPTPAQLFCSGPIWRLPWGGKFLPNSHHIPHLETWNDKAACFGPRNHLRQFPRSPVTGQFLEAPGCWRSERVKGRVLDPMPESVAGASERLWPRADPRTRHAKHDQDSSV